MKLDELADLVSDPKLIPGVYNYCDRWCERCPLTSRCANFAMGERHFPDGQVPDLAAAEFWEGLSHIFQSTLALLHEAAVEQGIDLDAPDPAVDAALARGEALRSQAERHPCAEAAFAYLQQGHEWFITTSDLFAAKEAELAMLARLAGADANVAQQALTIRDAVAVIQWYLHFIAVKLRRALQSQLEEAEETAEDDYPKDSDGSAKVALMAIDRSIGAWGVLLRHFPAEETPILERLVQLDRLRRAVEQQFPAARRFVRPGFDTGDLPVFASAIEE